MGGIAITIPNANFNSAFGNTITDLIDVPVTAITINCNDYYVGTQYQLSVSYTPLKTNKRGVRWSITSGSNYAAIDANTGVITIFESANMTPITVTATSVYDNTVTASKEIQILYRRQVIPERLLRSMGNISNVDETADLPSSSRAVLVKEKDSTEWTIGTAPPNIVTDKTEDEVNQMIEDGIIDENTLYFCEE